MEIKSLYQTGPVGKQLCALHFNKMFWHQQKAPLTEPAPLPLLAHLSGRLDERCRAPTRRAALNSFQQDSGCGDVAPWHAEARLRFPAAASRYMIGHLRAQTASRFSVLWLITPLKQIKPAQHMKGRLKLLWKIKHSSKLGRLHAFFSFFFSPPAVEMRPAFRAGNIKNRVILTRTATLKSFAIIFRAAATCLIKDMPGGAGRFGEVGTRREYVQRPEVRT